MLWPSCAPQATVPAAHHSLMTSVPSQDSPPGSTHELEGQLSLLWPGQKVDVGTIHAAPWQIVRHSVGSWHRPPLRVSSWRQRVEDRVFSHQLLSFLNCEWINWAKNLHFVSVPAHRPPEIVPVVLQTRRRLPVVHNLYNGLSDTLVVGELFICSLTHGYKALRHILLLL